MTQKSKTALFAGTFNPFTIGHKSIVDRTLKICDRVIIGFGCNLEKLGTELEQNIIKVESLYASDQRVKVLQYNGLTVDFAKECGADFLVRGVRDTRDFDYERNLAEINLRISGLETILLTALPELSFISSSMVRELAAYGKDISKFIP